MKKYKYRYFIIYYWIIICEKQSIILLIQFNLSISPANKPPGAAYATYASADAEVPAAYA